MKRKLKFIKGLDFGFLTVPNNKSLINVFNEGDKSTFRCLFLVIYIISIFFFSMFVYILQLRN